MKGGAGSGPDLTGGGAGDEGQAGRRRRRRLLGVWLSGGRRCKASSGGSISLLSQAFRYTSVANYLQVYILSHIRALIYFVLNFFFEVYFVLNFVLAKFKKVINLFFLYDVN